MFKSLRATKDTYITDRVVNGQRQYTTNVGAAGTLDLFKLYGVTTSGSLKVPNVELSRLLIKFDLDPIRDLVSVGKIDTGNPSFNCQLVLRDVYGGQPTPDNFSVVVHPLSASFDEGRGRDVVFYSDCDVCNWLTSSIAGGSWVVTGCSEGGDGTTPCDYITASYMDGESFEIEQSFVTGEEDLTVDVTSIVSATLAGIIPDSGFRIGFNQQQETDEYTRFVKRFASRTAHNEELHPRLVVRYDDSLQDDVNDMYVDSSGTLFLRNYVRSMPANLTSGSTQVTGTECLILQLVTPVSGGTHSLYFTGSQHYSGIYPQAGLYSASVTVESSDPFVAEALRVSGSIRFTPIWKSLDGTVAYHTGSTIVVNPPSRGSTDVGGRRYDVSVVGIKDVIPLTENTVVRVNVFDVSSPYVTSASRLPVTPPGKIVRDSHYQIRDAVTGNVVVPFDTEFNSTRLSNDSQGMYFKLDASNLVSGHVYVIDVLLFSGSDQQFYRSVSPQFRVGVAF